MMIPLVTELIKDWHSSVTEDMRLQQIKKLIMSMQNSHVIPSIDAENHLLMTNAQIAEKEMFELANSRSEYYYMLAEKIYKVHQNLEQTEESITQSGIRNLSNLWIPIEPSANDKMNSEITHELRNKYISKFTDDLRSPSHQNISLEAAKKAESICYERARTLDEYNKYISDVYKVKTALLEAGDMTENLPTTSQNDQADSKLANVMEKLRIGDNPDQDFNRKIMQLLIDIEEHSLGAIY